ncbi:MAG TPA: VWA domain-containing protein [Lapillicoccus sp.]|jgi:Ca-activated chloride channel family protein|uniref:VWA domain-containing protein n=1 Tax=Lapillicoccus sp. TaxID=1909287 RepID=UPI002F933F52
MSLPSLQWPWALLGLLAIPVVVVAYRRLLRQQSDRRADLAREGLVVPTARRDRWRHVAPVLLVAALAVMLLALSRPVAAVAEPRREGTVILAFDVSTSMAAKDMQPTRLDAAKAAAKGFVDKQPATVKIGVVAFGGSGIVAQQPTTDKDQVLASVNRLTPQGETSLGRGILTSLSAIAGKPIVSNGDTENGSNGETPIGYYQGSAIVLLTDGENTSGPDPVNLADLSAAAGVKIYPIGLGSAAGTVLQMGGFSIATHLDEDALKQIAQISGGTYYNATDATSLSQVYDSVQLSWVSRSVPHEITSLVAGIATLLLLAGAVVSVLRRGRVI